MYSYEVHIPMKTGFEQPSSTSSRVSASGQPSVNWFVQPRMPWKVGTVIT